MISDYIVAFIWLINVNVSYIYIYIYDNLLIYVSYFLIEAFNFSVNYINDTLYVPCM